MLATLTLALAVTLRKAAPDLLSFTGLACAPVGALIAWGIAGGLAVACPALILAGHAMRPGVTRG